MALGQALCAGLAIGATSVLSVGPNNLMMLREGVVRGRIGLVSVTVCVNSAVMILGAAASADVAIAQAGSSVRTALVWFGVALLGFMALKSFLTALQPAPSAPRAGVSDVVRALGVMWCNPLTYLELFFAPATVAQLYGGWARAGFFAGLLVTVTLGCCAYPLIGSLFGQSWVARGGARALDLASGLALTGAAAMTLRPLLL